MNQYGEADEEKEEDLEDGQPRIHILNTDPYKQAAHAFNSTGDEASQPRQMVSGRDASSFNLALRTALPAVGRA